MEVGSEGGQSAYRAPWDEVVAAPVGRTDGKPRASGLTMVIDKGLGLAETRDLLALAARYVDFLKIGFGTSLLYSTTALKEKIALARAHQVEVYPGGTLLEIAEAQGRFESFCERAFELGFTFVEVSEGTIDLVPARRAALIRQAKARGLGVVSEIGKKDRSHELSPDSALAQIERDLEAGASNVIVEGRDSGRGVGIYTPGGEIRSELFEAIVAGVADRRSLIWEAPLVSQQQALLSALGPEANFGNVQPSDVITLEATRRGLRGDTLRAALRAGGARGRHSPSNGDGRSSQTSNGVTSGRTTG